MYLRVKIGNWTVDGGCCATNQLPEGIHPRLSPITAFGRFPELRKCEQEWSFFYQSILKFLGLLADPLAARHGPTGPQTDTLYQ